jgi:hypothetical protein
MQDTALEPQRKTKSSGNLQTAVTSLVALRISSTLLIYEKIFFDKLFCMGKCTFLPPLNLPLREFLAHPPAPPFTVAGLPGYQHAVNTVGELVEGSPTVGPK